MAAGLCQRNLTIAIDLGSSSLADSVFAKLLLYSKDFLLHHQNNCKFFESDNSSEDLLKNNAVDIAAWTDDFQCSDKETPNALDSSGVLKVDSYRFGQFLDESSKQSELDITLFLTSNPGLVMSISIGYFLIISIFSILSKSTNLPIELSDLLFMQTKCLNAKFAESLFVGFSLFSFILISILGNTIKTQKVLIKTDDFINTLDKAIQSDKTLVIREVLRRYFEEGNPKGLLSNLYINKRNNGKFLEVSSYEHSDQILTGEDDRFLFFEDTMFLWYWISYLATYIKLDLVYSENTNLVEFLQTLLIRKDLEEHSQKFVRDRIYSSFENGLRQKFDEDYKKMSLTIIKSKKKKVYEYLADYIDEHVGDPGIHLANFENFFWFFIFLTLIVFFVFLMHHFLLRIKRYYHDFENLSTIFVQE